MWEGAALRDNVDETTAIQRLKHGDPGGLEALVIRYQLRAIRTAYLITHGRGLAEEVVQEAFLRLCRSIRSFDPERPFEPWFLRSVINASLRAAKRSGREVPLEEVAAEQAFYCLAAQSDLPEARVEAAEMEREIQQALEHLSPRQRAVIVQRYYLDMSEAEMASESRTAEGTIKWLLHAARRRLRGVMVERSDE